MRRPAPAEDPRIVALFAEPPERFTAARNALLRELESSKDPAAAAVKLLTRPTRRVWLLNRLARERSGEVGALLEAGERLREAHAAALQGRREPGLRRADDELGRELDGLVRSAGALLLEAGHPADRALLDGIRIDLRAAAAAGGDDARALRRGVLDHPPRAEVDDPFAVALAGTGAAPLPKRRQERARRAPASAAGERAARDRAEAALRHARRALAAAESELTRREEAAAKAEEQARRLRARTDAAAARRRSAREQAARAEAALRALDGRGSPRGGGTPTVHSSA
jgi:hypothetical protein